jgi:hypothetical protein
LRSLLGMPGTRAHMPKVILLQHPANRLLVQVNVEALLDDAPEIDAMLAHHPHPF